MEQRPNQGIPPIRIIPPRSSIQYSIGPRGFLFYLLAVLVLCIGIVGYFEYDRLVKPYMKEFLCCLPALILAGILFFLGFATRLTTVRRVNMRRPVQSGDDSSPRTSDKDADMDKERIIDVDAIEPENTKQHPASNTGIRGSHMGNGLHKYEPASVSKPELLAQKRNLLQFLKNLDEQHNDGLIMNGVYLGLKNKYNRELSSLNSRINTIKSKKFKSTEDEK
jgi:hypothetical protein